MHPVRGFDDVTQANELAKKQSRTRSQRPALGDYARICMPGVAISRVVDALLYPILLAGPNAAQRLERIVERLDGACRLSRKQRLLRFVAFWLLQEPNSEPDTTEVGVPLPAALRGAFLEVSGLLQEKQRLSSEGKEGEAGSLANVSSVTLRGAPAPHRQNAQGVR